MSGLSHSEIVTLLLALGVLLGSARFLGELAQRFHQPAVIGELLAGILLGPTVLGKLWPALQSSLFPTTGSVPIALEGLTTIAIVLFLVVAGFEIDLSATRRQGGPALSISVVGMVVPFALGFVAAWYLPWISAEAGEDQKLLFAAFFATALSISALPVVAKILMDLGLFRSDVGMIIIAAAVVNDLVGWVIFAFLLSAMGREDAHMDVGTTLVLLTVFAGLLLTIGRRVLDRSLAWVQAHSTWPGGVLGFVLSLALLCAAFTEWIGIHGIFGGFLVGVALGDSRHLRGRTRRTLDQFISYIFAPLFFASIGLKVDFVSNFDLALVLLVLVLATVGKIGGCWLGARLVGMGRRESWGIGCGMNARGAMEIILGLLALEFGLIAERMFVALVVMALLTSMASGGAMRFVLDLKKPRRFFDFMPPTAFVPELTAQSSREAIFELARTAASLAELPEETIGFEVWRRELVMSTSLGNRVAVPHGRLPNLQSTLVVVGFAPDGIEFDPSDDHDVQIVCMVLTPMDDPDSQVQVLADVARTFQKPDTVDKALEAETSLELLAYLRTTDEAHPEPGSAPARNA